LCLGCTATSTKKSSVLAKALRQGFVDAAAHVDDALQEELEKPRFMELTGEAKEGPLPTENLEVLEPQTGIA
jgi:hypothetical protein